MNFYAQLRDKPPALGLCRIVLGTKVSHFLKRSIPCALRALESDPRIAARKVATFGAAKALYASAATRSVEAVASRRPVDAGLTGSGCWLLLRRALRLGLS
jgi:hypothetical protein